MSEPREIAQAVGHPVFRNDDLPDHVLGASREREG